MRMAWACCLSIRATASATSRNINVVPRLQRRGLLRCLLYLMYLRNRFYDHSAFTGEFDAYQTKIIQTVILFFSSTIFALPILPLFKPLTTMIDGPLGPKFYSRHSTCFTGLWAKWQIRPNVFVTQAGRSNCWVGASELQSTAKSPLLKLNRLIRLWWLHLAGISSLTRPERPHQTWWLTVK